jgi:hypothetical protein
MNENYEERKKIREIGFKEICKRVRTQLKQEFPFCKFSVVAEHYSGGRSLNVSLMKCDGVQILKKPNEITENAFWYYGNKNYSKEQLISMQSKKYFQLNKYCFFDEFNEDRFNNGVFLTKKGYNLLKRVTEIVEQYNWDNSDAMIDYFDVNFYFHFNIGKYNKDYEGI